MPEVIFNGADGRLEGRYHHATERDAPLAVVLHPHPLHGGTMNNRIVYDIYHMFVKRGFSVLRFNFRGVGRSQESSFDHGHRRIVATRLPRSTGCTDSINPERASACWVAGFSFGAWIGMQLLMRRPEIQGFISVALPANLYDFSFLAPCPSSGLIVNGDRDTLVTVESVEKLVEKLKLQRGLEMGMEILPGADHFFTGCLDRLNDTIENYLDMRLAAIEEEAKAPTGRRSSKAKSASETPDADDTEEEADGDGSPEDDTESNDEVVAKAG